MLPKVANQILHHTSRAVAAVQNQTGQTIRSVLQLQSSSGPSSAAGNIGAWNTSGSSSSGWGSGPGAGGAKHQSSSRFHGSYSSVGRAATLVDPSLTHAANADSFDDPDETWIVTPLRAKHRRRSRSSSLSFTTQERDEQLAKIGVLKTVQLHVRARHAFAAPPPLPAAALETEHDRQEAEAEARSFTPDEKSSQERSQEEKEAFLRFQEARRSGKVEEVLAEVELLRRAPQTPSTAVWNAAMQALVELRKPGEPVQLILGTYHDMISRSVAPNFGTYITLMKALTSRDIEICEEIQRIQLRLHLRLASESARPPLDEYEKQLEALKAENAFGAALTLFQAACLIRTGKIPLNTYLELLRSCAEHGNVDAAIHVFAHLEKSYDGELHAWIYTDLIRAYRIGGDLQGAKEVFDEYKRMVRQGKIFVNTNESVQGIPIWRCDHVQVWTEMLATYLHHGQPALALGLLEEMMDTPKGLDFEFTDPPLPSALTFYTVIQGFIESGDMATALSWFEKLLGQQEPGFSTGYRPLLTPTQPDVKIWTAVVEGLLVKGMFDELTHILRIALERSITLSDFHQIIILRAYVNRFNPQNPSLGEADVGVLDLVRRLSCDALPRHVTRKVAVQNNPTWLHLTMCNLYLSAGRADRALDVLEEVANLVKAQVVREVDEGESERLRLRLSSPRGLVEVFGPKLVAATGSPYWSLGHALRLTDLYHEMYTSTPFEICEKVIEAYRSSTAAERDQLGDLEWQCLLGFNKRLLFPFDNKPPSSAAVPMLQLLMDLVQRKVVRRIPAHFLINISQAMSNSDVGEFLEALGDEPWANTMRKKLISGEWQNAPVSAASVDIKTLQSEQQPVRVDLTLARYVEQFHVPNPKATPLQAFERFEHGASKGLYPTPEVMAKLINALGRSGDLRRVRVLYDAAQLVLASLEEQKKWQSTGWFVVEDAMIIALAHAGDADGAHVHRARILEQGGSPSADAYGALIQCVKDTTDDTSNAMALFQEAVTRGVTPNIYLYNTAISKLAKARKADHALALFQEMRKHGTKPTSVTYGAVIAACCRVGDAQSAEVLFQEMASQSNFKPRVPPYNTMMQLYTNTKPDRERVLYYYNALLDAGVRPTAHTYKLLIDAFGTIEPVDVDAMNATFEQLVADPQTTVQGTHWAALINAWGCVRKDLDKAVQVFESIQSHPSTIRSRSKLPDAVVYEAMINVLVTLRRADLLPSYVAKMASHGLHMTAYIANLLIKGYAASGDIERSREIFESLADPPEGVAAPNNHAPHDSEAATPTAVPAGAPVYREPSTWEAMVRAELGNGNRAQAVTLLERVQARRFPAAVYNRISGIMLDDAVSPWAQTPAESPISDFASS